MIDLSKCPELERVPGEVSGKWIFRHTRLPLSAVLVNLSSGASLDEVSDWFDFPRARIVAVLGFMAQEADQLLLLEDLQAAAA